MYKFLSNNFLIFAVLSSRFLVRAIHLSFAGRYGLASPRATPAKKIII
jgi:hypothetical protein